MTPECSATIAPKIGSGISSAPWVPSARWCRREIVISIRRQAPTAAQRQRKRAVELTRSAPLQEQHLGREAGAERGQDAVRVGRWMSFGELLVQHEQHRGARLVAEVAQDLPRQLGVVAPQAELLLDVGQDLPPARMEHEAGELFRRQLALADQRPDQARDLALDETRDILGEHGMKAVVLQIEA